MLEKNTSHEQVIRPVAELVYDTEGNANLTPQAYERIVQVYMLHEELPEDQAALIGIEHTEDLMLALSVPDVKETTQAMLDSPDAINDTVALLHTVSIARKKIEAVYQRRIRAMTDVEEALERSVLRVMSQKNWPQKTVTIANDANEPVNVVLRVDEKTKAAVSDWDAFYKYVYDNQAFDLLTKGIASARVLAEMNDLLDKANTGEITASDSILPGVTINQFSKLAVSFKPVAKKSSAAKATAAERAARKSAKVDDETSTPLNQRDSASMDETGED